MAIPKYVLDAQAAVLAGEDFEASLAAAPYCGELVPAAVGDVAYDPDEGAWVIRAREADESFGCGIDCCGLYRHTVLAIREI